MTSDIDWDRFKNVLTNTSQCLQKLESYLNSTDHVYKDPGQKLEQPQLPNAALPTTQDDDGSPFPCPSDTMIILRIRRNTFDGMMDHLKTCSRDLEKHVSIINKLRSDSGPVTSPKSLNKTATPLRKLNPKYALLASTKFRTLIPEFRLHKRGCFDPQCEGFLALGSKTINPNSTCQMLSAGDDPIESIDLGKFPSEGFIHEHDVTRLARSFHNRTGRLRFLTTKKELFSCRRVPNSTQYSAQYESQSLSLRSISGNSLLGRKDVNKFVFSEAAEGSLQDPASFPLVARWLWATEEMVKKPQVYRSCFWNFICWTHLRHRLWFLWIGLTRNVVLKEGAYKLTAYISNLSADIHAQNEKEEQNSDVDSQSFETSLYSLRDLIVCLIEMDSLIDVRVPIEAGDVRIHNLMDMAGVPYNSFVEFYLKERAELFEELQELQDVEASPDMRLVKNKFCQVLVRSIEYFQIQCESLTAAVRRNDDTQFKVFLFAINLIAVASGYIYDLIYPPVWRNQIQEMYDNSTNAPGCRMLNVTVV